MITCMQLYHIIKKYLLLKQMLADILKVKSAFKNTLNYQQFLQHHKMLKFCLPLCPSIEILEKKIGRIK